MILSIRDFPITVVLVVLEGGEQILYASLPTFA